jgi:alkane 1-monooxygenase
MKRFHPLLGKPTPLAYCTSFILPVTTLLFLLHGPYGGYALLGWTLPFLLVLWLDWLTIDTATPNLLVSHKGFYDAILYALFSLQFCNIALMLPYVVQLSWQTPTDIGQSFINLVAVRFLVATSSGTSGIVVAHELIHRPQWHMQLMGRLLLCTVCYEHFVIAHKRGHHQDICLLDDIATARLGESFKTYWRRVYLGYLRYAWQSEVDRLQMTPGLGRLLHNQVLQGLLVEISGLTIIWFNFGWLAAFMFLYQAFAAVRILEAVNYFQHWGLCDAQFSNSYGWVSNSWLTRHSLIGLSHHIGHHLDANKRFYEISYSDAGPKLPYGYFVMNLWIKLNNASYQKMALAELMRYKKG